MTPAAAPEEEEEEESGSIDSLSNA